jgi:hypothetical protein
LIAALVLSSESRGAHLAVHPSSERCEVPMNQIIIGVDHHKLSATIEVVDHPMRLTRSRSRPRRSAPRSCQKAGSSKPFQPSVLKKPFDAVIA